MNAKGKTYGVGALVTRGSFILTDGKSAWARINGKPLLPTFHSLLRAGELDAWAIRALSCL